MDSHHATALQHHKQGNELLALGDLAGAQREFETAIAIAPAFGGGHNGLGCVLHAKHDLAGSIAAFREAIRVNGTYGEAADNLGIVLRECGDMTEAKQWMLRATELEPTNGRFLRHLADCEPVAADDPLVARLDAVATVADTLPLESRIEGLFAYAKVLGDLGRLDDALSTLAKANRLRRETIAYDEPRMLQSFELLARTFNSGFVEATLACGDPSARPIFIVGMPRSGTTLVEALLAAHPYVAGGGELTSFERCVAAMPFVQAASPVSELRRALRALGSAYIADTDVRAGGAARLTDKMPFNFRFVPLIFAALPNARIIHVQRNPLDVAYSCFATHFVDNVPFSYDLAELGRYYRAYENLMNAWRDALPPGTMLEIAYEDIVADVKTQARRMLAYCGLDWNDSVLRFYDSKHPVRSASQSQVRRPLYASSVGRAAVLRARLQPFEDALGRSL
jgi:tetratricopeptide (TPR) repeat protein